MVKSDLSGRLLDFSATWNDIVLENMKPSTGNNVRPMVIDRRDLIHDRPRSFYYDQDDPWVFPPFKNKIFV